MMQAGQAWDGYQRGDLLACPSYFPAQNDRRWRGRQFAKNDNTAGGDRR